MGGNGGTASSAKVRNDEQPILDTISISKISGAISGLRALLASM